VPQAGTRSPPLKPRRAALSYELLERQSAAPGKLLGQQAAAGYLGQALGSMVAGSLFTLTPMMPF